MRFDHNETYWVLMAVVKYSGVPWYIRDTGIPAASARTTSIREAKRFASRDEAIEWGNHLSTPVLVRRVVEARTYTLEAD